MPVQIFEGLNGRFFEESIIEVFEKKDRRIVEKNSRKRSEVVPEKNLLRNFGSNS